MRGLDKELYDNHSQDIPANYYEAYAYVLQQNGKYESAIRFLFKSIDLKKIMAKKYRVSKAELGGEEQNDKYYEVLDFLIKESILNNRKQILDMFEKQKCSNVFLLILCLETLIEVGDLTKTKIVYHNIKKDYKLQPCLLTYVEDMVLGK